MNIFQWFSNPGPTYEATGVAVPARDLTMDQITQNFPTPGAPIITTTTMYDRNNNVGDLVIVPNRGPRF